ncbi:MAG: UPF0175 family protein [Caldilineaceae bacterium]|nr:UPF0175 family protein [Caldilineaceae bacterium]
MADGLTPPAGRLHHEIAEDLIVLEFYRRRQISSGKAAERLNMERLAFIQYASRQGIPFFDLSAEEFADELALAAQLLMPA